MIPGAPSDLDLRGAIAMEQVAELIQRQEWEAILPVILLLDSDFEVIHQHILEDGQRDPLVWISNYARLYGAIVDLADSLIVTFKVGTVEFDESITGEPIIDENGVTPGGCVGHRHVESYMVALVSRDRPTVILTVDRTTGTPTWSGGEEIFEGEDGETLVGSPGFVIAFEKLMADSL